MAYIPSSSLPLCFCNHLSFLKTIISVLSGNAYVSITPKNQVWEHAHAMPVILIGAHPLASFQDTTPSFDPTDPWVPRASHAYSYVTKSICLVPILQSCVV